MDPFTIGAIGMGISAIGTGLGLWGSSEAAEAQQKLTAAQMQAEKLRYEQMKNEAERKRRQAIKMQIQQQHTAVSNATLQGAGESSGAYGAYGQTNQEGSWNVGGVNIAEHFGTEIYKANMAALQAKGELADAQSLQQMGAGISSLGGAVLGNMGAINAMTTPSPFANYGNTSNSGYGPAAIAYDAAQATKAGQTYGYDL